MLSDIFNTLYHIRDLTFSITATYFYRPQPCTWSTTYDTFSVILGCCDSCYVSYMSVIVVTCFRVPYKTHVFIHVEIWMIMIDSSIKYCNVNVCILLITFEIGCRERSFNAIGYRLFFNCRSRCCNMP